MPARPLPVLPGVYLAKVQAHIGTMGISNDFTFELSPAPSTGPSDVAAATDVAVALQAHWPAFANQAFHTSYAGSQVAVYALNTPLYPAVLRPLVAPGGDTGAPAPIKIAGVIKHSVLRRGRGSQSHTYLSPLEVTEVDINGIDLTPSYVTATQTAFDNMLSFVLSDLNAAEATWSYVQLSKIPPGATYPIVASEVLPKMSTQRRRVP